jgi:hypothetical protein
MIWKPGCRILMFAIFTAALVVTSGGLMARSVPVPAGTLIRCTLDEPNFSPRTARIGDPVVCYARPLIEFGCSAFPPGTQLGGEFVEYRKPGRLIGKGWMDLEFDRLILPVGEAGVRARVISVSGFKVTPQGRIRGHGHPKRDALGWMIPVLWPVKVLTLPMRGPEPTLRGERVFTLRLLDDITVPCQGFENGLMGTNWTPFKSSTSITPFSEPFAQILPFRTVERENLQALAPRKQKSRPKDANATGTISSTTGNTSTPGALNTR